MQFIDLKAQQDRIKPQLDARIQAVLAHGGYIMGPEVKELEAELAKFCGAKHVLSCANGTDALQLALMALEVKSGDAVFCPSFTFAATAEIVPMLGGTPYFVDAREDSLNICADSLRRTIELAKLNGDRPVGIIAVDLFGLAADYNAIEAIQSEYGLWLVGDSAQGFGAMYHGRRTGSIGTIATTSFFPAKPLGCYGDGGAVFTDEDGLAALIESYRVHGKGVDKYDNTRVGLNSRLDTLQAAILLEKLAIYEDELEKRQVIAERYSSALGDHIATPVVPEGQTSVWAQYTLKARDEGERKRMMAQLTSDGVPSIIYYSRPLHQQTAYSVYPRDPQGLGVSESLSRRVFSLPMHPYLEQTDQNRVIASVMRGLAA